VALQNQRNPVKFMDVADVAVWNPESGGRAQSGAGYEAELARTSSMSDAERRAIEAAELAVEAKALEAEATKSKVLPSSKPGGTPCPGVSPILSYTGATAGSDDVAGDGDDGGPDGDEHKVWEEF
jgi:hypothetical protein